MNGEFLTLAWIVLASVRSGKVPPGIEIMKLPTILLSASAMLAATSANAQSFFNNTTGLATPATTVNFNSYTAADGASITDQYSSQGVTFTGAFLNSQDVGYSRNYLANFNGGTAQDFSISFNNLEDSAAFKLITNSGQSTINVYDGELLVGSQSFNTTIDLSQYYGFKGASFNRVQIVAPVNGALEIGALQFASGTTGAVPEPATWLMMIAGFGIIGFGLRRRSKVTTSVRFA